jgi:hypothetical protein
MRLLILLILIIANVLSPAMADERIGAFVVSDDSQSAILLDGEIGVSTPLEFRRALALRPNAKVVVLSSDGGLGCVDKVSDPQPDRRDENEAEEAIGGFVVSRG